MPSPPVIADLVDRFEQQGEAYKSGQYNEAQLRQEFIDPMFKALGWDMENISGYAEAYKDVIHEDAIKIGGATKAPDYCFRIGGTRKRPDNTRHDRMVELVERMLALNEQFAAAKTAHEKTTIQRQIDTTDAQIDKLVYELYGLSEDEIKIVEGGA
jgi:hypothetical protein